jgi:predicted MFS family arabinose efflux permease
MSLVFSIKQTGVPLGSMLAGAIVPSLMLGIGWQLSLISVALVCLISAILSQPLRHEMDQHRQVGMKLNFNTLLAPIRMVLSHRTLATMAGCSFMFSMVQVSLTTYLVTYLHDDLSYGLVAAGLLLSVTQMGGIVGRVAWGYVADHYLSSQKMLAGLAISMTLCAATTPLLLPILPVYGVWTLLLLFGASAIGWNGVYLAEVARQAPEGKASVATGGTLTFTFLGVVVGPPLFGGLATLFGTYGAGFWALAVISSFCSFVLLRLKPSPAN